MTQVVHDLSELNCPALFVQFKWRLKQHQNTHEAVHFLFAQMSDLADVTQYLDKASFEYRIYRKENKVGMEILDV
ncbi:MULTISPECIES: hypothetical protein [unclassified Pseudoalteromonas]|uniref:hypothetical protein n=1 Tax=unclassified Pseudoalteromonas TaxID=194690 RepID=UPI0030142E81